MLLETFDAEQLFANRFAVIPRERRRRTSEDPANKRLQSATFLPRRGHDAACHRRRNSGKAIAQLRCFSEESNVIEIWHR